MVHPDTLQHGGGMSEIEEADTVELSPEESARAEAAIACADAEVEFRRASAPAPKVSDAWTSIFDFVPAVDARKVPTVDGQVLVQPVFAELAPLTYRVLRVVRRVYRFAPHQVAQHFGVLPIDVEEAEKGGCWRLRSDQALLDYTRTLQQLRAEQR